MKKIIALICTLAMAVQFAVMPVNAADDESSKIDQILLLKGLDIIDVASLNSYAFINNEQFAGAVSKYLFDYDVDAETMLRSTGMISADEDYDPEKILMLNEAVKYAVIALGYKLYADNLGGDEDAYMTEARTLGLLDGVEATKDKVLIRDDAAALLCNMLDVAPFSQYYNSSDDKGYVIQNDETLLSVNRNIEKIDGLVGKNSKTSMDSEEGCAEGNIEIDGTVYQTTFGTADSFLGRYVDAYIKFEKNGDGTVLYMADRKNKNNDLTVNAKDIVEVASDFSYIEYEKDDSGKYKKAKISTTPSVIYNGKFCSDYTVDDLSPKTGELKLLDNNNDGIYEMITVVSVYTMVIDTVSVNPEEIYNKITLSKSKRMLDLSISDLDYEIYMDGAKMPITVLGNNQIVSVATSKSGKFITLYASTKTLTGVLNNADLGTYELTIDNIKYDMTEEFAQWYEQVAGNPDLNKTYTFYMDDFGNIGFMKYSPSSNYMLYLKATADEPEEIYYVKYMDIMGVWSTDPLAKYVNFNGEKYTKEVAYSEIKDLKPQVVVIEKNSRGEIKTFKTPTKETKSTKLDDFTYYELNNQTYEHYVQGFGGQAYFNEGSRIFLLPDSDSKNEEDYGIAIIGFNFFAAWTGYTLTAYDRDEFLVSPIFSIVDSDSVHYSRGKEQRFLVTGMSRMCDENDEIRPVLNGVYNGDVNYKLIGSKEDTFSKRNVKVGDLIYFTLDVYGKYTDYISDPVGNIITSTDTENSSVMFSSVVSVDSAGKKIKYTVNDYEYVRKVRDGATIVFYDKDTNKARIGKLSELRPDQKILCTEYDYWITMVVAAE